MSHEDGRVIDLAVFDMAGTTVRDDGAVEAAFADAFASLDEPVTDERLAYVRRTMGQSKAVVFRALLGDVDRALRATLAFEGSYEKHVAEHGVQPIAGAEETFAALRDHGVLTCLTTGFSDGTREMLIDHLGWEELVDLHLSPRDGVRGRPYPDLVLAAVLDLAVDDVRRVAVVGDTASDLLAGTRAGAGIVAGVLTGAHDRAQLEAAPHTHILDSVADLPALVLG